MRLRLRQCACDCVDFRINGLGTCKHVEAVLLHLEARFRNLFNSARKNASTRIEVTVDAAGDTLRVLDVRSELPRALRKWFDKDGLLHNGGADEALSALRELQEADFPHLRISGEVESWVENRRRAAERRQLRHE